MLNLIRMLDSGGGERLVFDACVQLDSEFLVFSFMEQTRSKYKIKSESHKKQLKLVRNTLSKVDIVEKYVPIYLWVQC